MISRVGEFKIEFNFFFITLSTIWVLYFAPHSYKRFLLPRHPCLVSAMVNATALSSLRVLDMSRVLAGPWATQTLADLGAEVIKIERVDGGDDARKWGPPFLRDQDGKPSDESAYFHATNRNKKSIALDITHPQGQALLRNMVKSADVFIENFKVGGLKQYGLDYPQLKKINPRLIYCSITGFGQTGPYANRAGYDFIIQAMAGLMSITGKPSEQAGGGPVKVGVAVSDILTGLYACIAILSALQARHQSGQGQYIDLALMDVQVASLANQAMNFLATGNAPSPMGNLHPNIVPYQVFDTQDKPMVLSIGNDQQFAKFCQIIGRQDMAKDRLYAKNSARVENRHILVPLLATYLAAHPLTWWLEKLNKAGIPCGPINSIDAVFRDPQIIARQLPMQLPHPELGSVPTVGSPIKMSQTPVQYQHAAPKLGQHSREIAEKLAGKTVVEIEKLIAAGILRTDK